MSDPIAFPTPMAPPASVDDLVLDRLATWLAEVSAEAAKQTPTRDVESPTVETDRS